MCHCHWCCSNYSTASFFLSWSHLCGCLYFYSQDIPSWKSKVHYRTNTSDFLCCKTWFQVPCTSEIPRIFRVLSLSFLIVLKCTRPCSSGWFIPQNAQVTSAPDIFCDFFIYLFGSLSFSRWLSQIDNMCMNLIWGPKWLSWHPSIRCITCVWQGFRSGGQKRKWSNLAFWLFLHELFGRGVMGLYSWSIPKYIKINLVQTHAFL